MQQRTRRAATIAGAATALVLASTVAGAATAAAHPSGGNGVSFSSTPVTSAIVSHTTITPAMRGQAPAHSKLNSGRQDQLPDLAPKDYLFEHDNAARTRPTTTGAPVRSGFGGTPRTTASFIGQQGSNITCSYFAQGCNPPDMAIAASPYVEMQGVNTQWEVLDRRGHVLPGWPVSAQSFFGVPNQPGCDPASGNQPFMSDPRAYYDAADHRFWAAMLQVEGGLGIAPDCPPLTLYWIAVSQTSNPSGSWNVYAFEMSHGTPFAADFTQIGINRDALFFSANMFGLQGGFYAEVFEANKAQMEAGRANFTADGFANIQGNGPGIPIANVGPFLADTLQPVSDLGGGSRDGLFVDTVDGPDLINGHLCSNQADACHGMILWRMSNPIAHDRGGPAPTFTGTYLPNTQAFTFPPAADQPTCSECVDGNDLRIPAMPMMLDGTIYTGWGTGFDNGTDVVPAVVWAEVHVYGHSVATRTGYFALAGDNAATYPAFMPDGNGNVVMVYEHMSSTTNPEAKYVSHGAGRDFAGTGRVLKAGEAPYRPSLCGTDAIPVCRWGDYEAASFDGYGRIWMAGEYANSHTDPTVAPFFGRNWGTWIGAIDTEHRR
jgi:hypothetical protein